MAMSTSSTRRLVHDALPPALDVLHLPVVPGLHLHLHRLHLHRSHALLHSHAGAHRLHWHRHAVGVHVVHAAHAAHAAGGVTPVAIHGRLRHLPDPGVPAIRRLLLVLGLLHRLLKRPAVVAEGHAGTIPSAGAHVGAEIAVGRRRLMDVAPVAVVEGAVHVAAGPLDVGSGEGRGHLRPDGGHLGLLFPDLALLVLDAASLFQGRVAVNDGVRAEDVGHAVLLAQGRRRFRLHGTAAQHHLPFARLALGLQSLSALAESLLRLIRQSLLFLALVLGFVGIAELGEYLGREGFAHGAGAGEVVVPSLVLGPEAPHTLGEGLALDRFLVVVVRLLPGSHALGGGHLVQAKLAQSGVQGVVAPLFAQRLWRFVSVQTRSAGTQGLVLLQVAALHQTQRAVHLGDGGLARVEDAERDVVLVRAAVLLPGPVFPGEGDLLLLAMLLLRLGDGVELYESGVHAVLADVAVRVLRPHPRVVLAQLQLGEQGRGGAVENAGEFVLHLFLFVARAFVFGLVRPLTVDVVGQGLIFFPAAGHRVLPRAVVGAFAERHEPALLLLRGGPDMLFGQQDGGRGRLAVLLPVGAVHLGAQLAGEGVVCEGADGGVGGSVEDAVERGHGGAFLHLELGCGRGQLEKGACAQLRWQLLRSPWHFGLAALLGRRLWHVLGLCWPTTDRLHRVALLRRHMRVGDAGRLLQRRISRGLVVGVVAERGHAVAGERVGQPHLGLAHGGRFGILRQVFGLAKPGVAHGLQHLGVARVANFRLGLLGQLGRQVEHCRHAGGVVEHLLAGKRIKVRLRPAPVGPVGGRHARCRRRLVLGLGHGHCSL
ncbi:hypothetical protein CTA1_6404 [Colletotrichum tanaceti]|uniref:Uncharacterized protein n=1 Tax=Colletotrichum tanaceti TaxID=1306861 RepID=A0A4U6XFB1_9PEZI|nr:hypothetical protein CTA1_6404 [Colletotrichum tanaceti]